MKQKRRTFWYANKKRAEREGWTRDLSAKIKAKADALVTQAAVTQEVTQQRAVTERATIETNAQMLADKVINQREDIKRARSIVQRLWEIVWSDDSLVRASRNLTGQISNPAHELNLDRAIIRHSSQWR